MIGDIYQSASPFENTYVKVLEVSRGRGVKALYFYVLYGECDKDGSGYGYSFIGDCTESEFKHKFILFKAYKE